MTDPLYDPAEALPVIDPPEGTKLWAVRQAPRVYLGHNDRGASVLMGPVEVPGALTPGELLQLALIGCAGMSSDKAISRRLGEETPLTLTVESTHHETEDRYARLDETLLLDLTGLDEAARKELGTVVERAIQRGCTVGLTLKAGAEVNLDIAQADPPQA